MQQAQVNKPVTSRHGSIRSGLYGRYIKRLLDIICSLTAIVVFGWLYIIIAVLVRIKLGSPVLFKQPRPGKIDPKTGKEKIFTLYKFRSMSDERDENGDFLPDEVRLGKFGRALRATSLDELPETFNILKGDMSIVGPRPLVVSYLPYYTEEERHRHDVRPGLTGLAQVNGRNDLNWNERFAYDIKYVNNLSFSLDVRILFKTVGKVLKKEGIGQGEERPGNLYDERQRRDFY
ncbi:sugar transferase [uncultured Dysosmobacter sp.]|uniref:sugar transferase n=1 Tax=uncultured Dysosmobacter sp. TaxID=2591384 RepID=UPI002625A220|nr:sugar transferase [uncultured Dysosmobacter sp.]